MAEKLHDIGDRLSQGEEFAANDFKTILEFAPSNASSKECEQILIRAKALLDPDTSTGQALLELVGWDLPVTIAKYVEVSERCRELASTIIHSLATSCSPREIHTTLMEALHIYNESEKLELLFLLMKGLSSVLLRIQRRRAEFAKETVRGVLSLSLVTEITRGHVEDEDINLRMINELLQLCQALENMYEEEKLEDLWKTLTCFTLILMTIVDTAQLSNTSSSVSSLINTLQHCGVTASTLLDPSLDLYTSALHTEDSLPSFNLEAGCGAALAALYMLSDESSEKINVIFTSETSFLNALNRFKDLFTFTRMRNGSLKLLEKGIKLIELILAASPSPLGYEDQSSTATGVSPILQVLQEVVVRCPDSSIRKSAYDALLNILRRLSPGAKFLSLVFLINNGSHPSIVSLLLTFTKDEIHNTWTLDESRESNPFITSDVLHLVESVIKAPKLPEDLDSIVSALNLYRFLLIREKSGRTNYTGIRTKDALKRTKHEYLEPLRYAASALLPCSEPHMSLLIDSLQMIVYRCLELVEDELLHGDKVQAIH